MPRLIVKIVVGPQGLEQGDGAGGKDAVCPHHDQKHCAEEPYHGLYRVLNRDSQAVTAGQSHKPHERQQALCFWFALPGLSGAQQFHRPGPVQAREISQQRQTKEDDKQLHRLPHGPAAEMHGEFHRKPDHSQQQRRHQIG